MFLHDPVGIVIINSTLSEYFANGIGDQAYWQTKHSYTEFVDTNCT